MPRYSIAGFRGGEDLRTPTGAIRLHPHDAAAELTPEQVTYFESAGHTLTKAATTPAESSQSAGRGDDLVEERLRVNAEVAADVDEQIRESLKQAETERAALHKTLTTKPKPAAV